MNIRLLRIYSVPIRISSPELHVGDTCLLHENNIMGRNVTTTYRLHNYISILSGYVSTTYLDNAINNWVDKNIVRK